VQAIQVHVTGLADEKADVITKYWSVTIKEITSQVNHHRKLCQFFQQLTCLHSINDTVI